MSTTVSVVIPTHNRAEKVRSAVESVLAQTTANVDIIVVDDGSCDDTEMVLRDTFGSRIRYFRQRNQGASVARNRGIEEARGAWIAFLDSDDLWERNKLEWQLKALERFGPQCLGCYTDVRFRNHPETRTMFELGKGSYEHTGDMGVNPEALRLLVRPGGAGMVVCLSSFMVRADVARRSGGFNPKLLYSQDSEFMFRLAMDTGFCYVNKPLVSFDRSPAEIRHVGVSAEWNKMDFFLRDSQLRLEGLLRFNGTLPKPVRKIVREQLRDIHSGWTNWYLESGQYEGAREAAWKAIRTDLTFNVTVKWLLTWINPRLALRTVKRHREGRNDSTAIA